MAAARSGSATRWGSPSVIVGRAGRRSRRSSVARRASRHGCWDGNTESWQDPVQAGGDPPVGAAEELHDRGHARGSAWASAAGRTCTGARDAHRSIVGRSGSLSGSHAKTRVGATNESSANCEMLASPCRRPRCGRSSSVTGCRPCRSETSPHGGTFSVGAASTNGGCASSSTIATPSSAAASIRSSRVKGSS
jgi:hypothetical protein